MFEDILNSISSFTPFWIYVTLFLFAFVENVFPPSPSDLVVVIGGSLVSTGVINFVPAVLLTTIGSVIGFMILFYFGSTVDRKVVHSGKYKYIPVDAIEKVELWFKKYGYYVIVANRFMPGTRSVISFFSGMSSLNVKKTLILATTSALVWNAIIIYLGYVFGNNRSVVDKYLSNYSSIAISITVIVVIIFVIKFYMSRKKNKE
ncbi:MAG: DedA family protein [Ignavibacteriaceae bacterium]|jgi:membrane protein DedA with SNARE-associated domain